MKSVSPQSHPGQSLWIGGATASGKTTVAIELASLANGEIVTVDSMQVYQGLDIGTAKPSAADQQRVPHHLLDVIPLSESFSAGAFVVRVAPVIEDILRRGRTPILCGGSGLYFMALLNGLGPRHESDPEQRRVLEAAPLSTLINELQARDPESLVRLDLRNRRRVIRAVEQSRAVCGRANQPRTSWQRWIHQSMPGFYALQREPADLRERIDTRVEEMITGGIVEETRSLLTQGLADNRTAMQSIGYRQIVEYLQGARNWIDTVSLIKQRTWQFARKQRNWFERQLPARLVSVSAGEPPVETARLIHSLWRKETANSGALSRVE